MDSAPIDALFGELAEGRTELVFDLLSLSCSVDAVSQDGISLVQHCAYYGDVSALRFLLSNGASLSSLGDDVGLAAAVFHGHWRLCKFLIEQGADVNQTSSDTGETPLHSAICTPDRVVYDRVVEVLLASGANPNCATRPGLETGAFMRDCKTKGETPLHRAAAFGESETIAMLLEAGAILDAKDAYGETPLSWASWYLRPTPILRQLCYGEFRINPHSKPMRANLIGRPLRRTPR